MKDVLRPIAGLMVAAAVCIGVLSSAQANEKDPPSPDPAISKAALERGAAIYKAQCLECHGDKGQGVQGEYEKALGGERTLAWLTRRIERTMPEGEADKCVGEDAAAVAAYLYEQHYSAGARAKLSQTAGRSLQRLTVRQHRQSLADLIGSFRQG